MIPRDKGEKTMTCVMPFPGHELLLPHAARAENNHVFDKNGNKYLDLEAGVWCVGLGHGRPEILEVIRSQYAKIAHTGFGYGARVVEEAASRILDLHGFDGGKLVFLCSGSEAVEYGVRVARMLLPRPLMLTMADSYFGAYGSAHDKPADQWFAFDWTVCAPCPPDRDCRQACPHFDAIPFDRAGGFLFEPGSSGGLVRFPPKKLVRAMARKVRENQGLLMVNEVTTGMGRTGEWFGYQQYGLSPDIVAMGKGLGNGYPVSATALGGRVADLLGGRPVLYAQSHMNDPLGAVVAMEVVRIIGHENLVEKGRKAGLRLKTGLEKIAGETGRIRDLRIRGLMAAVELRDNPEADRAIRVHRGLFKKGYIVARRSLLPVLRMDPCLTVEGADLDGFVRALGEELAD